MAAYTRLSLVKAQRIILAHLAPLEKEEVSLAAAQGRVASSSLYAITAQPSYSQSLYDGFVISRKCLDENDGFYSYQIRGEVAAGDIEEKKCRPGDAYRIMTGAPIPAGGRKVVPQEYCRVKHDVVCVPQIQHDERRSNILKKGAVCRKGAKLFDAGHCLSPADVGQLADAGHANVDVRRRPVVAHCCTGNELVSDESSLRKGLKISSNRFILDGLVRANGGIAEDWGTVSDNPKDLEGRLQRIMHEGANVIISTGGMGPGKYDLVKDVFRALKGEVIFTGMRLRPGKRVLFGKIGDALYFGLPGPPAAVKVLFHVLVRPALLKMQGMKAPWRNVVQGCLEEDLFLPKSTIPRLKEGVFRVARQGLLVRPVKKFESANCFILCPAERRHIRVNSTVSVYLTSPPAWMSHGKSYRF